MKLTFLINAIANYGRLYSVIKDCVEAGHEVSVIAGGSAVVSRFAQKGKDVAQTIEDDFVGTGIVVLRVHSLVEEAPAESVGLAAVSTAGILRQLDPDFVIVIGDRYETLGSTCAAYFNRPKPFCIIHFQGGEKSGTLDEGTRKSISGISHYHVPATEEARDRLIRGGVNPDKIVTTGCPGIDLVRNPQVIHEHAKTELLVAFHPNTCDESETVGPLLEALDAIEKKTIMIWPNADAGSQKVMKDIRKWREEKERPWLTMRRYLHPCDFAALIAQSKCCVGNSSAFVREAVAAGTPVVLIGKRQQGRVESSNIKKVGHDAREIESAVRDMMGMRYKTSDHYGGGHTAMRFVDALESLKPYTQVEHYEDVQTDAG